MKTLASQCIFLAGIICIVVSSEQLMVGAHNDDNNNNNGIPSPAPDALTLMRRSIPEDTGIIDEGSERSHRALADEAETDPKVGTALAPTTPGGKCLSTSDYQNWKDKGFDNFGADMQACAEECTGEIVSGSGCGFLCNNQEEVSNYEKCVRNCMSNTNSEEREAVGLIAGPYGVNCSVCMGALSQCVVDKCKTKCVAGEKSSGCEDCTVKNCNDGFRVCSGLNAARVHNVVDAGVILGVVLGVAGFIMIISITIAYFHFKRSSKAKELTVDDLASLAAAQQQQASIQAQQKMMMQQQQQPQKITQQDVIMMVQQAQQYGVIPPANGGGSVVPYMMQPQIQPMPMMTPPPGMGTPSVNVQKMYQNNISLSRSEIPMQTVPLTMQFDFVGERVDELTCSKGDSLHGVEENDGWWLARDKTGKIGLVPTSYVKVDPVQV